MAVIALLALTLNTLGSGTVLFDVAGFERYSRIVDSSAVVAWLELLLAFGPSAVLLVDDFRISNRQPEILGWRVWGNRLLGVLALAYVLTYATVLRLPWLLEQATAQGRLDVWSARLSSTVGGVPIMAFSQAVGLGSLLIATTSAALREFGNVGYLQTAKSKQRVEAAVWLLCAVDFLVGAATIITFATGGFV